MPPDASDYGPLRLQAMSDDRDRVSERFVEIRREAGEAERSEYPESTMPPPHGQLLGWRIDKSFSIGNIVTVLTLAGSAFFWGSNVEKRLAVHDESLLSMKTAQERIENNAFATRIEIRGDLLEINRKLDRVIERTPTSRDAR